MKRKKSVKKTNISYTLLKKEINNLTPKILKVLKIPYKKFKNPTDQEVMYFKSIQLFINHMALAKLNSVPVRTITYNPYLINNREELNKIYSCMILNPTEARFGFPEDTYLSFINEEKDLV